MIKRIQKHAPFLKGFVLFCLIFWLLGNLLASDFNVSAVESGKAFSLRMGADVSDDAVWTFKELKPGFFLDTVAIETFTETGKVSIEMTCVLGLGWRAQNYRFERFQ